MIKDEKGFARTLSSTNEWWISGSSRKAQRYPKKRALFTKLQQDISSRRITILSGPRRVGKSVILHQIIQMLLDSGAPKENIVYYSMDDPNLLAFTDEPLKDIVDYMLSHCQGKIYVLLDEIQACRGWYKWVKAYYDRELEIKFVISGSSSLAIQSDANQFLRGRTTELELFPLDFAEFLFFHGLASPPVHAADMRNLLATQDQLAGILNEYLLVGGFPEWFEIKNQPDAKQRWLTHLLADVPKKAIYEDIAVYFNIRNPKVIDLLINAFAIHQSKILSYEKLNETVQLDRATLLNYIEFLKSSYLVLEIPVYGPPPRQLKAMKKFLLVDQGLRNSLMKEYTLQEDNQGFIVENVVGVTLSLNYTHVTYWKDQTHEVDYIADGTPIEVKYQNTLHEEDFKGILKFLETHPGTHGVVITKDQSGEKTVGNKKIKLIPFWMFLLEPRI